MSSSAWKHLEKPSHIEKDQKDFRVRVLRMVCSFFGPGSTWAGHGLCQAEEGSEVI